MGDAVELDRDAVVALLDQALIAEARGETPPDADRRNWLYGNAGYSEPDQHGWMMPVPTQAEWVPRALVFWRAVISSGGTIEREWIRERSHSLIRWPVIEEAIGDYLLGSIWLVS